MSDCFVGKVQHRFGSSETTQQPGRGEGKQKVRRVEKGNEGNDSLMSLENGKYKGM